MNHRILEAIGFITLFSAILTLLHWYIWRRLVRDPRWPRPYRRAATLAIALLGISLPTGFILWRVLPRDLTTVGATISYVWLGALFYLVVINLVFEVVRLSGDLPCGSRRRQKLR